MTPSKHKDESKEDKKKRKETKKKKKAKRKRDDLVEETITTTTIQDNLESSSLSSLSKKKSSTNEDDRKQRVTRHRTDRGSKDGDNVDTKSPFQEKKVRILVSLPPASLTNIPNALNESIQKLLLKYSNSLGGVLVSFRDIELEDKEDGGGRIINEMPHIHYNVRCTVMIFNPTVGTVLSGKVNESFPSHVGVLVHELFNAMISAESLKQNGFIFDDETNEWKQNDEDLGRVINIEDGMELTVDKLHECNGLISLECTDPSFITIKN